MVGMVHQEAQEDLGPPDLREYPESLDPRGRLVHPENSESQVTKEKLVLQ